MYAPNPSRTPRRPAAVLLVVLALLALFAVIGLSFVLYAESEANAARIHRTAIADPPGQRPNPDMIVNQVVNQIVFGADDRSAFHGHDLRTLKYGGLGGDAAYNGVGTFSLPINTTTVPLFSAGGVAAFDRKDAVLYTPWNAPYGNPNFSTQIDPETAYLVGGVGGLRTGSGLNAPIGATPVVVPKNAGYTYPDRNNLLVAMQNPSSGQLVAMSGHRGSLFKADTQPDPNQSFALLNPNWYNIEGHFKTLRPRPYDHMTPAERASLPGGLGNPSNNFTPAQLNQFALLAQNGQMGQFPFPPANADGTITGDVQNIRFSNGSQRNDAIWVYPNLGVSEFRGKLITPMVAVTLLPLDGRVNVNAAGNVFVGGAHGSHSGFGPHEINLGQVVPVGVNDLVARRFAGGTITPTAPELPGLNTPLPAPADELTPLVANGAYPNNPLNTLMGVKPFHPLAYGVQTANGGQTVLGVSQLRPPGAARVNYRGEAVAYQLPGTDAAAPFNSAPNYSTYTPNFNNSAFTNVDPNTGNAIPPVGDALNHPLLWNPYRRASYAIGEDVFGVKTFPLADLRHLGARYSVKESPALGYTYLGKEFPLAFGPMNPNHPANRSRALTTPISNSQQVAALAPNFFGIPAGARFRLEPNQPFPALSAPTQFDLQQILAGDVTASDTFDSVGSNSTLVNRRARLGPIDLNRPLADYRSNPDPANKLSTLTVDNELNARFDRQMLAHDIFIRLAVATGATIRWDAANQRFALPTGTFDMYTINAQPVSNEEYNALRWLAQFAVNIVDMIDPDDISTPFVWNPLTPITQLNEMTGPTYEANFTQPLPATLGDHVVFGTEKPRLVLNEVYAEVTNDESEAVGGTGATQPFQARFFAELLNPGNPDPDTIYSPLVYLSEDGLTSAYRLQVFDNSNVTRQELHTGPNAISNVAGVVPDGAGNKLRIQMPLAALQKVTQATDTVDENGNPVLSERAIEPNNGQFQANPTTNRRHGFAFIGPGPTAAGSLAEDASAFIPNTAAADQPFKMMLQKPLVLPENLVPPIDPVIGDEAAYNQMAYYLPAETNTEINTGGGVVRPRLTQPHAVLLQRLANPYLPFNPTTNPYITIDAVYDVKLHDAIRMAKSEPPANANGNRDMAMGHLRGDHASAGRVQPFAGYSVGADPYASSMAESLTLRQRRQTALGGMGAEVLHTFMKHNGDDPLLNANPPASPPVTIPGRDRNLDFPFAWLPHFDRRLINQEELLRVSVFKPHELTHQFARPDADPMKPRNPPAYTQFHALGRWLDPKAIGEDFNQTPPTVVGANYNAGGGSLSPIYRALELLTVKPWMHDVPFGGRVPGKININMIWDPRVFHALVDPNAGSSYVAAPRWVIDPATGESQAWRDFRDSRTPGFPDVVGTTRDESATGTDRPFKAFGAARFDLGGNLIAPTTADETLLRTVGVGAEQQLLFSTTEGGHPYRNTEPLRKILNNVTTTSDTFLLVFTVGYFEVRAGNPNDPANPIVLGREVFDRFPSDLRSKYAAVLDRSNLATTNSPNTWVLETQSELFGELPTPTNVVNPAAGTPTTMSVQVLGHNVAINPAAPLPNGEFETTRGVTVVYEGVSTRIEPGNHVVVGTGRKRLILEVQAAGWTYDPLTGRTRIPLAFPTSTVNPLLQDELAEVDLGPRTYPHGTMISNVLFKGTELSSPGVNLTRPSSVVPFFTRITP